MTRGVLIGRVRGVEIRVHWSWLVIFGLVVWTLAAGVFPTADPDRSDTTYLIMALVGAFVFFGSLLLHELGHVVQAQRDGMQIDGISLWLIGGIAQFRGMFPSPAAERRVALAGPLVSVGIGVTFVAIGLIDALGRDVTVVARWLGIVNLGLAAFNLLPAQPLDGGRVLHAFLWSRTGDLARATRNAGRAGEFLGYLLVGVGLILFVVVGDPGGVWLAVLGGFLLSAARAEVRSVLVREALRGLRVRDLMTPDPVTVRDTATLGEFVDTVAWTSRFTTYPVVDGDGPVGLLRFRDVAAVPREHWDHRRVADLAIPLGRVGQVAPDMPATQAFDAVIASAASRVLVVDGDRLVGILSLTDALRAIEAGGVRPASRAAPGDEWPHGPSGVDRERPRDAAFPRR
jgi:Zn-dependent protease/CBS domain-containing protein